MVEARKRRVLEQRPLPRVLTGDHVEEDDAENPDVAGNTHVVAYLFGVNEREDRLGQLRVLILADVILAKSVEEVAGRVSSANSSRSLFSRESERSR